MFYCAFPHGINFGSVYQSDAQNVHLHAVTVPWFAEKQKAMIKKFRITWGKTRLRERDGRRFRKWHNTKKEKKNVKREGSGEKTFVVLILSGCTHANMVERAMSNGAGTSSIFKILVVSGSSVV